MPRLERKIASKSTGKKIILIDFQADAFYIDSKTVAVHTKYFIYTYTQQPEI